MPNPQLLSPSVAQPLSSPAILPLSPSFRAPAVLQILNPSALSYRSLGPSAPKLPSFSTLHHLSSSAPQLLSSSAAQVLNKPGCDSWECKHLGCHPALFSGEDSSLSDLELVVANPVDACTSLTGDYEGKAVILMRSRGVCSFAAKTENLMAANAAAMIVVNEIDGQFPVRMQMGVSANDANNVYDDSFLKPNGVGFPACMAFADVWEKLVGTDNSLDPDEIRVSFANYRRYNFEDEEIPENDITVVKVSQLHGGMEDLPAAQATFNPEVNEITAPAVLVEWDPLCWAPASCEPCWSLDSPISNKDILAGKHAVVHLEPTKSWCFVWMYEVVAYAQWAGAAGMIYVNRDDRLWTYTPHLVPVNLTIPMVNIMHGYGDVLMDRLETGEEITLVTPEFENHCNTATYVCIASGPHLELTVPKNLATTTVLVTYNDESRAMRAGQASFNPESMESQENSAWSLRGEVVKAEFHSNCSISVANGNGEDPCKPCIDSFAQTAAGWPSVLTGKVALFFNDEFACIGAYHTIVESAQQAKATAVLISASDGKSVFTMHADSQYKSDIPAFSLSYTDYVWITTRLNSPNSRDLGAGVAGAEESQELRGQQTRAVNLRSENLVKAHIPVIVDGSGTSYNSNAGVDDVWDESLVPTSTPPPAEQAITVNVKIVAPAALSTTVTAGNAAFNPPNADAVLGFGVWSHWDACADLNRCAVCESRLCEDLVNQNHMDGRIALIWNEDTLCLDPAEAVKCVQSFGANAAIYVNENDGIVLLEPSQDDLEMDTELCEDGSNRKICIPTYNIPKESAVNVRSHVTCAEETGRWMEKAACQSGLSADPELRISIDGAQSSTAGFRDPSVGTGKFLDQNDEEIRGNKGVPVWAVVLIVIAILGAVAGYGTYMTLRKRARRRAYILSALDAGTQFNDDDRGTEMQGMPSAPQLDTVQSGVIIRQVTPGRTSIQDVEAGAPEGGQRSTNSRGIPVSSSSTGTVDEPKKVKKQESKSELSFQVATVRESGGGDEEAGAAGGQTHLPLLPHQTGIQNTHQSFLTELNQGHKLLEAEASGYLIHQVRASGKAQWGSTL